MKTILLLHLLFLFFAACSSGDEVQTFISGTYIRFSKHEFGTEHDTLVISLQNGSAGEYKIVRRWKYERVLDGNAIEPEYKFITTSGIYYSSRKLLQERETGDFFSFDVTEKSVFNGPVKYQKL